MRPRRSAARRKRIRPTWPRSAPTLRPSLGSRRRFRLGSRLAPALMSARPAPSRKSGKNRRISLPRRAPSRPPRARSTPPPRPATWPRSRPASASSARPARPATTSIVPPKTTTEPEAAPPPAPISTQPVWDLPIRLFHWLLAALIGFSWWSVKNGQPDWHIWSGFAILTLLVFRLLWGLFGSSTARFANFVRGPAVVRDYLRDNSTWRFAGHSPLGALSVVALLAAVAVQVGLGLVSVDEDGLNEGPLAQLVSLETSEAARDLHESFFNILLALIVVHVAAIVFYRLLVGRK